MSSTLYNRVHCAGPADASEVSLAAVVAAYVALAEALPATLLTADDRLARAPGLPTRVERIG